MRKLIVLLVITLVITSLRAQDTKFRVGVELTPTISWLSNNLTNDYSSRISVAPGISFDYLLNKHLAIKSGLVYEPLGVIYKIHNLDENGNETGQQSNLNNNLNYLTLPVMFSYSTKGRVRFYVNGGVFFGFLLSHKYVFSPVGDNPEEVTDVTDETNRLNFGITHGLGLNFLLGEKLVLDLGLRNNIGLTNTQKDPMMYGGTARTGSLGLVLGVKYKL